MTPPFTERGGWTSASSALPDLLCPGRHLAQRGIPEPEPSEEAKAGTRIHAWLAAVFRCGFVNYLEGDEQAVADDLHRKFVVLQTTTIPVPTVVMVEQRIWATFGLVQHSGQPDIILLAGKRALICDFKTGWGDVPDSDTNLQLRDLAVLLWRSGAKPTTIDVAIVSRYGDPVVTRYELADLKHAEKELKARVKASNNPQSKRIPGPVQCRYCWAFGTDRCPESAFMVAALARNDICDAMESKTGLQTIPPERLIAVKRFQPLIIRLLAEATAEIKRRLKEDPASVPGAVLKPGKVLHPITDPDTVFERLSALGVPRQAIMAAIKMTKKPIEEAVRETTGLNGRELDAKVDELLRGCTTEKQCDDEIELS